MVEFKEFNDKDLKFGGSDDDHVEERARPYLEEVRSLRKYKIPTYPMFIGRDKKASVCVPVSAVSRRHAKVFEKDGVFYAQDCGSINGTFVNDKRILDPVELNEGDRLKVAMTKDYPRGVREFIFKHDVAQQQQLEQKKKDERDILLKDVGIIGGGEVLTATKKIPIRHCVFTVTKKDIVSVLKAEQPRQVPIETISLKKKAIDFLSLFPYKEKDNLQLTIKHPRLATPILVLLKVLEVAELETDKNILLHKTEIVKFHDLEMFKTRVDASTPFICYIKSEIKEKKE